MTSQQIAVLEKSPMKERQAAQGRRVASGVIKQVKVHRDEAQASVGDKMAASTATSVIARIVPKNMPYLPDGTPSRSC
jgi:DNA-directed RNA polymerase beta subunit